MPRWSVRPNTLMDTLPAETVLHILTFLEGEDATRLKLLNSHVGQLISTNQSKLRRPLVNAMFYHDNGHLPKMFNIHFYNKFCFFVDYATSGTVIITPVDEEYQYYCCPLGATAGCESPSVQTKKRCNDFFRVFFERNYQQHNVQTMFQFIFEKLDINELNVHEFHDNRSSSDFLKAINNTPAHIREVQCRMSCYFAIECKLLKGIAYHSRRGTSYPKIMLNFPTVYVLQSWNKFKDLNEIASLYKSCWYAISSDSVGDVIRQIALGWLSDPFPKFNFGLSIASSDEQPTLFDCSELSDRFEVKQTNGNSFLLHSTDCDEASVQLVDRVTKCSLTFKKKNGSYTSVDYRGTELKHIYVSIHVCLQ